jgi:alkyl sulfatase BDS1-like metallo-beta-lactamase superfamily hydrolase
MTTRREFVKSLPAFAVAGHMLLDGGAVLGHQPAPLKGHFHPKGKAPSKFTIEVLKLARAKLPFADRRDFEEQKKGLIAPMKDLKIMADAGHVAWDMERFQFLDKQEEFDSIHPSLHRVSVLQNSCGLYEVIPGIYQVRGFDIAIISFVRGKTGWIVIDPLVSAEVVRAAWKLFQEHVGKGLPVSAVIYSHPHADHWGGVRGVVKEEDVRSGKFPIIACRDFMRHTISENVYAGNAMNRRLFYQYGLLLPASPHGHVGQGVGQGVSAGATGLIPPTRTIDKDFEEAEIDGVKMVFQNAPRTEAPEIIVAYIPEMKALCMTDIILAGLHNIYTLRGAPIRDALNWSKSIAETLQRFGATAEVMFTAHSWPRWGNERVQDVPKSLQDKWYCRGYHGAPSTTAAASSNATSASGTATRPPSSRCPRASRPPSSWR